MQNNEIKELVKAAIETKIIQSFHDAPEAIDTLVRAALEQEVDDHGGKPSGYSRERMPYLEWLVGDTIRTVARAAVVEAVKKKEDEIKKAVEAQISSEKIVDGLTQKIMGTLNNEYSLNIRFANQEN